MVEAKDGNLKRLLPRAEYNMADTRWRELRCWLARKPPRTASSSGRSRGSSSQNGGPVMVRAAPVGRFNPALPVPVRSGLKLRGIKN